MSALVVCVTFAALRRVEPLPPSHLRLNGYLHQQSGMSKRSHCAASQNVPFQDEFLPALIVGLGGCFFFF